MLTCTNHIPCASTVLPAPASDDQFLLLSRKGCCLCEGLEQNLRRLDPVPVLRVLDIDDDPWLKARYDLEVPLLFAVTAQGWQVLPRCAPRLRGEGFAVWLQKQLAALGPA
ncbi:MAG: glutaredoxin family protein [Aphanocapsa feldmannii 277cV]|uniref:Glutaredoxin family protein n=2 Tax=Aphanocapsa feldmannii TaxID=192050 RepID=A0A524RNK3_9CHRO|nr:MAG: glutaredoxin family protein [Aphanocapsa feldmannii 288cV]TGG92636.1 MAG: glutaredoxin family protein [Aphanocapsa feldmannii 277cV]TGH24020.1 MAG: glutaredoxin family protein [Aphanocapsa feldmannii 277cI]